ncbi:hypothetical protein [Patulibacter sp. SYSU D01012]|uniref:peptidoglycan-binding domain-containing protein n=1 Tax=Patulibacter sp. SYSU D01012 TaxID=2817381 RepID=UPI001B30ED21|nr:hypothetical protein [Patulibacter sp. SYSU D01012]
MSIPILKLGARGKAVERLQNYLNDRGSKRGFPDLDVDGELGPITWERWKDIFKALGGLGFTGSEARARRRYEIVAYPDRRTAVELAAAKTWAKRRATTAARGATLRERAWNEAGRLVGIVEKGGNNRGPEVEKVIRGGGGLPGQAWCGWLNAWCYRKAGSLAVTWQWGAVRLYLPLPGLRRTSSPKRGNIVRFTFDHTGLFGSWCDARGSAVPKAQATHIRTREGNTGSVGAVSDGNGKDGVHEKVRSRQLVRDFIEVLK